MKTRLFFAFFFFAAFSPALFSQQITETTFGDSGWNAAHRVWQMPDGNFALATSSYNAPSLQRKLYHYTPEGTMLAEHDLPAPSASLFIEPSPDGSSFYYGRLGNDGYTIYHLNLNGQILDSIVYDPNDPSWEDYYFAIRSAPGGHFVLAYKNQTITFNVRLARLDGAGNIVFNKILSSDSPDFYNTCLEITPDGRTVVLVQNYDQQSRLMCFSPAGALLWNKALPYQIVLADETFLLPMHDGGIAVYGRYGFDGTDLFHFAVRYSANGNLAFARTFESDLPEFVPYHAFSDGNQLVVSGDYNLPDERGLGVIKLDAGGQTVFVKKFKKLSGSYDMKSALSANGDYIFSASRYTSPGNPTEKGYVLSLQPDGTFNWFDSTQIAHVRNILDILQRDNGDLLLAGSAYHQPLPATGSYNMLLRVSGIGPVLAQLIEGKVLRDSIENCEPDPADPELDGWVIKAATPGGERYAVSDAAGNYKIRLNANSANVSVSMPNDLWQPCEASYPLALGSPDTANLDIPVRQTAQCPLLSLDGSAALLRRCFDNTYYFNWCNNGTAVAENAVLTITLDSFTTFVSSSLPLAAQNGQEITFQTGNLAPGQCANFSLKVNISCEAALGQIHCLSAALSAAEACPGHPGHIASLRDCQANIGSFDPNDKSAFVNDTLREGNILPNAEIGYRIRFQNTGTDTAFNIVVVDTIPNTLDISTLRLGASSHPYEYQLHGSNIVKFIFNNILLPDSNINEAASHGFVNFKIAQKPDLPLLTEIENKADIFFDYNQPVATNRHKLVVNRSTSAPLWPDIFSLVQAYPNPSGGGQIWLESRDPGLVLQRVMLFDAMGRQIGEMKPFRPKVRLELPEAKGVYFAKIYLNNGRLSTIRMIR